MKKADWDEYLIWICPYVKCNEENKEYGEASSGRMVECEKCSKMAELV